MSLTEEEAFLARVWDIRKMGLWEFILEFDFLN